MRGRAESSWGAWASPMRSSTPRARAGTASACSPGGPLIAGSFSTPKRHLGEPRGFALGEAEIEADGAAIDIAERRERLAKRPRRQSERGRRVDPQHADKRQLHPVLRKRRSRAQSQTAKAAQTRFIL